MKLKHCTEETEKLFSVLRQFSIDHELHIMVYDTQPGMPPYVLLKRRYGRESEGLYSKLAVFFPNHSNRTCTVLEVDHPVNTLLADGIHPTRITQTLINLFSE